MAQKKIIWTETAARQRISILQYWLQRNQSSTYAESPDTHVAAIGHFSLFYKTTDSAIIITAFWDNRQEPKELLKLLKSD